MTNGYDIREYNVKKGPIQITYSLLFEEMQAMTAMGLSYQEYMALPGSPEWALDGLSKSEVVVWHRMSKLIPVVVEDAQARKTK